MKAAEEVEKFAVEAGDVGFETGLLADLEDFAFDLLLDLVDDFLNARGVDAAVLDKLGEGAAGDLAPDGVESADDDDAGSVVDDDVDAGGTLERADVASFAADDAALHLIVGDIDCGDGGRRGVVGGVALQGGDDDFAGLVLGLVLRVGDGLLNHLGGFGGEVVLQLAEEGGLGIVAGHAGDAQELGLLLLDDLFNLGLLGLDVLGGLAQAAFAALDGLFLGDEGLHFEIEQVVAFVEAFLDVAEFLARDGGLLVEFLLFAEEAGLRLDLGGTNDFLGLTLAFLDSLARLLGGQEEIAPSQESECEVAEIAPAVAPASTVNA